MIKLIGSAFGAVALIVSAAWAVEVRFKDVANQEFAPTRIMVVNNDTRSRGNEKLHAEDQAHIEEFMATSARNSNYVKREQAMIRKLCQEGSLSPDHPKCLTLPPPDVD